MATKYRNGYRTAVSVGKDATGKRQYLYFEGETADEANFLALEYKTKHKQKKRPANITLGEALDKYIIEKDAILSPSTIRGYRQLRKHAYGELIEKLINQIEQSDIQKAMNKLAKEHKPKTVRNAHGLLASTMKSFNPDFILNTTLPQKIRPSIKIPSDDELKSILRVVKDTDMELPIMLAAFLSLRRSEACGIKVSDVDLEKAQINISRAIVANDDYEWVEKGTKTYTSKRTVYMPEAVLAKIKHVIETKSLNQDDNLIQLSPDVISKRMGRICKRAGEKEYTFHEMRHYFASKLHSMGVPDQYAMQLVGHKTTHMLQTVYQHIIAEKKEALKTEITDHFNKIIG